MRTATLLLLASSLAFSFNSNAASIGDPAPKLVIDQWVKGGSAQVGAGTNIYVVEFWATWCPPCRESIPRLTELQKKYARNGVVIIGVSKEAASKVVPFVAQQGDKMNYRVAVDLSEKTWGAWMAAYGQSGIPHAFVVDRAGKVAWHGFPNSQLDRVLQQMVDGSFDLEAAKNVDMGERMVKAYVSLVRSSKPDPKAALAGQRIISDYSRTWTVPYQLAKAIFTDPTVRTRDLQLGLQAANKAVEMTGGRSSDALEMQARGLFATGKRQEAIQVQKKAIELCSNASDMTNLKKFLALYEKTPQTAAKR